MAFKPGTILYQEDKGIGSLRQLRDIRKVKPFQ
jgi:hypothetical protein